MSGCIVSYSITCYFDATHLRRSGKVNGRRLKAANLAISSSATLVHAGGFFQLSEDDVQVEFCRNWIERADLHLERGSVPIRRGILFSMAFSLPLSRFKICVNR